MTDRRRSRSEISSGGSSDEDESFYDADEYDPHKRMSPRPSLDTHSTTATATDTNGTNSDQKHASQQSTSIAATNPQSHPHVNATIPATAQPPATFPPQSASGISASSSDKLPAQLSSLAIHAPTPVEKAPLTLTVVSPISATGSSSVAAPLIPPRPSSRPSVSTPNNAASSNTSQSNATTTVKSNGTHAVQAGSSSNPPSAVLPSGFSAPSASTVSSASSSGGATTAVPIEGTFLIKNLDTGETCALDAASSVFPEVRAAMSIKDFEESANHSKTHSQAQATASALAAAETKDKPEEVSEKKKTLGFLSRIKQALHISDGSGELDHLPSNSVKVKTKHRSYQDLTDVKLVQTLVQHAGPVWTVAVSTQGDFVASGGQDSIVRVWAVMGSTAAKELDERLRSAKAAQEAATSSGNSHPAAHANSDGSVNGIPSPQVSEGNSPIELPNWEADYSKESGCRPIVYPIPFRSYAGHKADVIDLAWSKANFLLSASIDKTVRLWHVSRQKCLCVFQHADFVTAVCMPEHQTRLLTNAGFMFLDEIESHMARAENGSAPPLLFASLDVATQQLVYGPGKLVLPTKNPSHLVDFTQRETKSHWIPSTSNQYGSTSPNNGSCAKEAANHLSLLVTPEHKMYVSVDESNTSASSLRLVPAKELVPSFKCNCGDELPSDECPHARSQQSFLKMQAALPEGFVPKHSLSDSDVDSPIYRLNLRAEGQLDAFLQLYGYWLGCGSIAYCSETHSPLAVSFDTADLQHLQSLISTVGLTEGVSVSQCSNLTTLAITDAAWVQFFDDEYWIARNHHDCLHVSSAAKRTRLDELAQRGISPSDAVMISANWFHEWVLTHLNRLQIRLVLDGLCRASSEPQCNTNRIFTNSVSFREQLQRACMHAGFSSHFHLASNPHNSSAQEQWVVEFSESSSLHMRMSDIVHDGAAPHVFDKSTVAQEPSNATIPSQNESCAYDVNTHGRIFCVEVEHPDHLIVAQRACRDERGVVTKASKPVVVGNCFHPIEDRYFVSGSFDKKLRIWNIPEHRVVEWAQTSNIITAATFNPNGNMTVAGLYNGQCVFYQTDSLKYHTQVDAKNRHGRNRKGKKVTGMQFSPDGKALLVTTNDSRIRLFDMDDFSMIAKFKGTENDELQIRAWFSEDGSKVICGSENQHVYVWSAAEYQSNFSSMAQLNNGASGGNASGSSQNLNGAASPTSSTSKPDVKCDSCEYFRAFSDTCTSAQFMPNNSVRLSSDTDVEASKVRHLMIAAGYQGELKFFENKGLRKPC